MNRKYKLLTDDYNTLNKGYIYTFEEIERHLERHPERWEEVIEYEPIPEENKQPVYFTDEEKFINDCAIEAMKIYINEGGEYTDIAKYSFNTALAMNNERKKHLK